VLQQLQPELEDRVLAALEEAASQPFCPLFELLAQTTLVDIHTN